MARPHEIVFFTTDRGNAPVEKYLGKLSNSDVAPILAAIEDIGQFGFDGTTETRHIIGDLWEIKVGQHRIFYASFALEVVLLHAYKKQSNKAPIKEIDAAKRRLSEEQKRRL